MAHALRKCFTLAAITATFSLVITGTPASADGLVIPGFELYEPLPGTVFNGVPFVGSPLSSFDFGTGAQSVGNTSIIRQRLGDGFPPANPVPVEIVALQLMSAVPADFGLGLGTYFITLQSARGGPQTFGTETIAFGPEGVPHGTFDSFFDVFFDIRLGAVDGPIALSANLPVTSLGNPWAHNPPPGSLLIDGINHNLNGSTQSNDFWAQNTVLETTPNGALVFLRPTAGRTAVPEPGSLAMLGGVAMVAAMGWRRRRVR